MDSYKKEDQLLHEDSKGKTIGLVEDLSVLSIMV